MGAARLRIALGQISTESNQFVSFPCELELFRRTGFLHERGDVFQLAGSGGEIGGMLATLATSPDVEIVPLLAARCNSSGPLSTACYRYLKGHLLAALQDAAPVDGVLLSCHGSMAAMNNDDPEGDLLEAVRAIVGPAPSIVITLDLHGNVTERMVHAADAILGYEHYPHHDVYATGIRGASLLLRAVRREISPTIGYAKLPMLLTAFHASTEDGGPFAQLMEQAKALERQSAILSTSLFLVGSYLDVPEIGCSVVVIADGDASRAIGEATTLASAFWARRLEFSVRTWSVAQAVAQGRQLSGGPVLLLDTADTTGGGAAGDSSDLVRGLLEARVTEPCLAMVVDPTSAQACIRAGMGHEVLLELGHTVDPAWGRPLTVRGTVAAISDGRFLYTGGILGGSWASMGPSAVLDIGSIRVLIMSYPTYEWADEQYRALGVDPSVAKFVGIKNMMNFRTGYGACMKGYFVLDLPGPTPADMRALPFRRVARPLFPLDTIISPQVRTATSRRPGATA
ncbi:MAG TPA: M81 family metallopeptidase [Chloroflexota bacterium]|nr:M81 family metallopeptidase [Chloroflexota bacterium]